MPDATIAKAIIAVRLYTHAHYIGRRDNATRQQPRMEEVNALSLT
jgi:hypothetical protein